MTTKSLSAMLLAATVALGLATGTAFAGNDRAPVGYVYQDFWGGAPAQQQPSATGAAHLGDGASIGIYTTHNSTGTHLFPPNPFQ